MENKQSEENTQNQHEIKSTQGTQSTQSNANQTKDNGRPGNYRSHFDLHIVSVSGAELRQQAPDRYKALLDSQTLKGKSLEDGEIVATHCKCEFAGSRLDKFAALDTVLSALKMSDEDLVDLALIHLMAKGRDPSMARSGLAGLMGTLGILGTLGTLSTLSTLGRLKRPSKADEADEADKTERSHGDEGDEGSEPDEPDEPDSGSSDEDEDDYSDVSRVELRIPKGSLLDKKLHPEDQQ